MGLIIKDKIPSMMKGYPTMSDKYNVAGGVLSGTTSVGFGELVKYSSSVGYYEAITSTVTLADIAGFVLATNVKLANEWPANDAKVNPKEAFNLLLDGFIAVKLESTAVTANIKPGKACAVLLNNGKLTTSGVSTAVDLPNVEFTGFYEAYEDGYLAEVRVK